MKYLDETKAHVPKEINSFGENHWNYVLFDANNSLKNTALCIGETSISTSKRHVNRQWNDACLIVDKNLWEIKINEVAVCD